MKIKVIGIGGIGNCLLPVLLRFLNYEHPGCEVTLIDGDSYEERNRKRQKFDRPGNKAEVTTNMLKNDYDSIYLQFKPVYAKEDNIGVLIREGDIIFSCVDRHIVRKLISDRCCELDNAVLISGGNELTDGNMQINIRKEGADLTLPIANSFHSEILDPEDKNPGDLGCDELAENKPQELITNNAIAAVMLNAFYACLVNKVDYDEVYVDILTNNARQVCRR